MANVSGRYFAFSRLVYPVNGTEIFDTIRSLIERNFTNLLNRIKDIDEKDKYGTFIFLIHAFRGYPEFIIEKFTELLNVIENYVLNTIKENDFFKKLIELDKQNE